MGVIQDKINLIIMKLTLKLQQWTMFQTLMVPILLKFQDEEPNSNASTWYNPTRIEFYFCKVWPITYTREVVIHELYHFWLHEHGLSGIRKGHNFLKVLFTEEDVVNCGVAFNFWLRDNDKEIEKLISRIQAAVEAKYPS